MHAHTHTHMHCVIWELVSIIKIEIKECVFASISAIKENGSLYQNAVSKTMEP